MPAVGDAHVVAGKTHQRVLAVAVVRRTTRQSHRGVHQERAENVEHPSESLNGRGAQCDEDATENQCDHNPDEEGFALMNPGHAEARHDDDEDEQVVDREAVLGEPPGEKLDRVLPAMEEPRPDSEASSEPDVSRQAERGPAHRRFPRPAGHHQQVEQQYGDGHAESDDPLQQGDVHGDTSGRWTTRGLFHRREHDRDGPRAGHPIWAT